MASSRGNGTISSFYDFRGELEICVKNDRDVGSLGVFYGDNPFTFVLPSTLCQLFMVVLINKLVYFLLKPLRTPKFICNILGGIILGPSLLGRNKTLMEALFPARQSQFLVLTSMVSVAYFSFMVGLKMDIMMTIRAAKRTWRLGVVPFLSGIAILSALLYLYHEQSDLSQLNLQVSRFMLSMTMSVASFPVMCEALTELNLIATELGQIAISSSLINDNILWFLTLVNRIVYTNNVQISITYGIGWALVMVVSIFMLRPAMQLIVRTTPIGEQVKEIYIVFILLGALVMACVSDLIGAAFTMGPLLYGVVMPSGPPLGTTLVEKSETIITEFLLPFFFVSIGMKTNLFVLRNWQKFLTIQGVFLVADMAKVVACVLVSLTYNIKAKHGMVLGFMMNIKGITQLITFLKLLQVKLLDEETFSHFVFCVVFMTAIITPLVDLLYRHSPRVLNASKNSYEGSMLTIQSTPRDVEFRIITCVHKEGNVCGITTLLEACNPVLESPLCVYVIHLVELLGKSAPILLLINKTKNKKFLSVNYPDTNHITRAFDNYSRNSSGPITIIPFVNVAPYKSMHNGVCNLAQDKMVPLLIIPFHENDQINFDGHVANSIRKLNVTFQGHAPCTLGILVDRFSQLGRSKDLTPKMYFHVGIFFIGGPDDREALSLGIRMSERVSTRVTLFRFSVMTMKRYGSGEGQVEEEEEYNAEELLDESLVDEYKSKRFGGGNVSWYDIKVEDGTQVLEAIRGLEGSYDLVIVGRRHNMECFNDDEMGAFIENDDILGILGDMLSSAEFGVGRVPVLVTRCGRDKECKFEREGSINIVSQTRKFLDK